MWCLFSAAICDGITFHYFGSIPNLSIIIFNLFHTCYSLIAVNDNSFKDKCRKIKVRIYIYNILVMLSHGVIPNLFINHWPQDKNINFL